MIRLSKPMISEDEINAVTDVLKTGMLVQGKYVEKFESSLRNYMKTEHVSAVSSGTAALHIALAALNIGEGDAVFVPAFTFPATANVVEIQKARTLLVDVEPSTYNIDPDKLEEAIISYDGKETLKAIMVVHEFGGPANMTRITEIAKRYNLYIIEDAACSLGSTWDGKHVGTFGDMGCFSWHPRKAITTGEGGAIVTNNKEIKKRIGLLRNHGIERSDQGTIDFVLPGFNYRLTEFQAVLGEVQLKKFDSWKVRRKELAERYLKELSRIPGISLPDNLQGHVWQTFMIVLPETLKRDDIINQMKSKQIETNLGAQALHMLSYFKSKYQYNDSDFPIAKKLYQSGLALPLHPELIENDVNRIVETLKSIILK